MVVGRGFARRRDGQETGEQGKVEHTARLLWEGCSGIDEFMKGLVERRARKWAHLIQRGRVDTGRERPEGLELARRMEEGWKTKGLRMKGCKGRENEHIPDCMPVG